MKKTATRLVCGLCVTACMLMLSSFTNSDVKQSESCATGSHYLVAAQYKELLIQVEDLNEKNMSEIRTAIEASGGVIFKGYCSSHHILMYLVNRDTHPDNTFLNKLTALSYSYVIKEGTISQVSTDCGVDPIPADMQTE